MPSFSSEIPSYPARVLFKKAMIALLSGFDNIFSVGEKAVLHPFSGGGQGTVHGGTVDDAGVQVLY